MLSRIFICAVLTVGSVVPIAGTVDATQPSTHPPGGRPKPCVGPIYSGRQRIQPCFEADKQPKNTNAFKQMYRPPPK